MVRVPLFLLFGSNRGPPKNKRGNRLLLGSLVEGFVIWGPLRYESYYLGVPDLSKLSSCDRFIKTLKPES